LPQRGCERQHRHQATGVHLLGLLRAFWESGLRVPQDVAVVGFDDVAGSAFFIPPLTTVRQDFAALGRLAIDVLSDALAGSDVVRPAIPATLVVRASSVPAAG
jgi:DNA-binding LacI/PurR family transcriptional regulator